jgi:hypothetical protein
VYVLLASGITAAVSQVLIAVIRSDRNIELQQRAVDQWSRISFLIESDVAEGNRILYGQALPAACGNGTVLFSVAVPVAAGSTLSIQYFTRAGNLLRCGPSFNANGDLNLAGPASLPALVGRRVQLTIQENPDQDRSVHYHLNILSPESIPLFSQPRSSIARTRVGAIEIPP